MAQLAENHEKLPRIVPAWNIDTKPKWVPTKLAKQVRDFEALLRQLKVNGFLSKGCDSMICHRAGGHSLTITLKHMDRPCLMVALVFNETLIPAEADARLEYHVFHLLYASRRLPIATYEHVSGPNATQFVSTVASCQAAEQLTIHDAVARINGLALRFSHYPKVKL